jgi:rubrerythrin
VSDFLFAVNKAIIDAFRRGTGDIKEARAFMVSAASWSESAGSVFRRGSLTKAEQHGKKAADAAWAAGSYDERLGEDIEAALRGLGENKLRPNPVKTFFCFPCGRRFIATGRASEANCPDCHRVCRETKTKHRSNPRRRARRGR